MALLSPEKKTLLQAIKNGHFTTCPNLKVELINHLPPSMSTAKVHMKQIRENINSTKTQGTPPNEDEPMETLETRSKNVFDKIIYHQQRIATDLTERLPVTSNRVNKYLFILYNYNSNCILVRPMKNRTDKLFIRVLQDLHGNLNKRGLKPNYMKMRHCQNYKTY